MNYEIECSTGDRLFEIEIEKFDELLLSKGVKFIDVREYHELPLVDEFEHARIPLGELKNKMSELTEEKIVFFCQSGIRSRQAAAMAAESFGDNKKIL